MKYNEDKILKEISDYIKSTGTPIAQCQLISSRFIKRH